MPDILRDGLAWLTGQLSAFIPSEFSKLISDSSKFMNLCFSPFGTDRASLARSSDRSLRSHVMHKIDSLFPSQIVAMLFRIKRKFCEVGNHYVSQVLKTHDVIAKRGFAVVGCQSLVGSYVPTLPERHDKHDGRDVVCTKLYRKTAHWIQLLLGSEVEYETSLAVRESRNPSGKLGAIDVTWKRLDDTMGFSHGGTLLQELRDGQSRVGMFHHALGSRHCIKPTDIQERDS